ncbi:MAG: hypothetical protein LBJ46_10450 [Planctomycetota bacterium]|jgi:hypothetical protein|nr:hypothetical protein [Planctomycetota bacterium]
MLPDMTDLGPITQAIQTDKAMRQTRPDEKSQHVAARENKVEQPQSANGATNAKAKPGENAKPGPEQPKDIFELSFHLTQEERDSLVKAFSKGEALAEREQSTLRSTAERISKAIEETLAQRSEKRERVEKAVSEWYSKIAKGEARQPLELVKLLRMAALGQFDFPVK